MDREPIELFGRLEKSFGENALTEALAAVLKVSPAMRESFTQKAIKRNSMLKASVTIETRPVYKESIPDLQIKWGDACLILCEMKVDSPLTLSQWSKYQKILDARTHIAHRQLIGVVAPWTDVDPKIPSPQVWQWRDVHNLAYEANKNETDPIAIFLTRELMDFLEAHNMSHFHGFSEDDLAVIGKLAVVNSKLDAFLSDVAHEIARSLKGKTEIGKYKFRNYEGHQAIYGWVEFTLRPQNSDEVGIWVGIECSSKNTRLQIGLWKNDMWPQPGEMQTSQTKALKQYVEGHGFEWDPADGYWKYLVSRLNVSDEINGSVKSVAKECTESLIDVFSMVRPL